MNATSAALPCPFVGLQPFTEADADYFFGRERDQRIIAANLYAAPLTVLYGASGVGKSSILLAGVVPYLRTQPRTAVVVFRDWQGTAFFETLKVRCLSAVGEACGTSLAIDWKLPFDELLAAAAAAFKGEVVVIFDQFEEYFLYHPESEAGSAFEAQFARAVNREDVHASFLLALRDDGLAKLDRFRARIPNLLANTLRLKHLTANDAESAIRRPLNVFNERHPDPGGPVVIEDQLVGAVIAQVRTGQVLLSRSGGVGLAEAGDDSARIEAPFLQLVMTRLWEEEMRSGSRALCLATLERLGGAQQIVASHLDGVMAKLGSTEQEVCSRFFDRLVTPSGSKIACSADDLTKWAGPLAEKVPQVLAVLSENRILRSVANPGGKRSADSCYEVYHDVLAPAILDWRRSYLRAQDRAEADRRAEEQRQRAEEQARIARRLRRQAAGLVALVFIGAGLALWANEQRRVAATNARLAVARELTAASMGNLSIDPERSVLLAVEAVETTHAADRTVAEEAEDALRRAVSTSQVQLTLRGHNDQLRAVAFSPDGARLATASWDRRAKVWDAASGKELFTLSHDKPVTGVAFGPDGTRLATASEDGTARLWDAATGAIVLTLAGHGDKVDAVSFSPDGTHVATASRDRTIKLWDATSGVEELTIATPEHWVVGLAFSPDGSRLASASVADQPTSTIWELASGRALLSLPGRNNAIAFSPNGRIVATAGRDRAARLWDAETGAPLLALLGHVDQVRDVAFNREGTRIATAGADHRVKVWDAATGQELISLAGHSDWVNGVAFSPDDRRLASAGRDRSAKVWSITGHTDVVYAVAFSPDGRWLATASGDRSIKLWDTHTRDNVLTLTGHADAVYHLAFSPDSRQLATASFDKTARVWDTATGRPLLTLIGHRDQLRRVAFSPDGSRLATASADGTAKVWDLATGQEVLTLGHRDQVQGIAFSPDGARLATASRDQTLGVWNAKSGERLLTIPGNGARFNDVAFSPDGRRLASASNKAIVQLWDAASGEPLRSLLGHAAFVNSIAFSPDGTRLVTASGDMTAKIWDLATGEVVRTCASHTDIVNHAAFSADGKQVATASSDWSFQFSPLDVEGLIALAQKSATRSLSDKECRQYLHVDHCPHRGEVGHGQE